MSSKRTKSDGVAAKIVTNNTKRIQVFMKAKFLSLLERGLFKILSLVYLSNYCFSHENMQEKHCQIMHCGIEKGKQN